MTADPREPISEITETSDMRFGLVRAFAKAWFWGSLTGAAIFLVITVPLGIVFMVDGMLVQGIYLMTLPILIAGAVTLAAMLAIGLPLTAFLAHQKAERVVTYEKAGGFAGFCIPLLTLIAIDGGIAIALFLALFGAAAGLIAAHHWGRWRVQRYRPSRHPDDPAPSSNPYHDMIY